jgi:hypothetical protein
MVVGAFSEAPYPAPASDRFVQSSEAIGSTPE